nr:MAG TPA: hypothetical protein [Bacteriophage sp.]
MDKKPSRVIRDGIAYALNNYTVADLKDYKANTKVG